MKCVFFGNATIKNAAIRARLMTFADMLAEEGHDCRICLPSSIFLWERLYDGKPMFSKLVYLLLVFFNRILQLRHVPGADVIFFRGPVFPYGPTLFEYLIHRLNPRMVFDIDDAVWERPAFVTSPFVALQDFDWVWKMCRLCRHAIAGNDHLRRRLEQEGIPVTVVPTCVDMNIHKQKRYLAPGPGAPVTLGWTGLSDNLGYLDAIAPVLTQLARANFIRLYIASDKGYRAERLRVDCEQWQLAREIEYLQVPDIGLMPLAHTPRAEGKCGYKALEFMAVGTPCVISPVGMNKEILKEGVTGFFADSPEEWHEKLQRLIRDPNLCETMGRAARNHVAARYAHTVHYPRWKEALMGEVAAPAEEK